MNLSSLDPQISTADLEAQLERDCMLLGVLTFRLIAALDLYDAREGYRRHGMQSTAHFLAWRCKWSLSTAREHVRVARALRSLPLIRQSFADRFLSFSQVRALTRVATPTQEAMLIRVADNKTAAQLEDYIRTLRNKQSVADESVQAKREFLRTWWEGGMMYFHWSGAWIARRDLGCEPREGSQKGFSGNARERWRLFTV
ncbi:MAG: DUF222 domain-containing protein [Actinomycetota bacterium]